VRNSDFIKGVNIIAKYIPEDEKDSPFGLHSEHDQLWFGGDEWVTDENDRTELFNLGWFISEDSWSCFN
jgi:hypothetical protein